MPHAGLMDANALGHEMALLMRARLHIRGGKRRLRQGKISAGLVTLHDALSAAMEWYMVSPERRKRLGVGGDDDMNDDKTVFNLLRRSGVLDASFDYESFDGLVEKALDKELAGYDYSGIIKGIESVMTQLGVMPFDESELPPEDPSTF